MGAEIRELSGDTDYTVAVHLTGWIGPSSYRKVPELLVHRGWKRPWVIVDRNFGETSIAHRMLEAWRSTSIEFHVSEGPIGEPTYEWLEESRTSGPNHPADVVIGVGGGSTIDTAKGLAVLARNPGPAISYRGFERYDFRPLPILAIPTLPGAGAEVTPNASFVDERTGKKLGINGEGVRPALTILDPELCLSAPHETIAATGFDALVHAVEAFASNQSNPISQALAREATRMVWTGLDRLRGSEATTEILEELLVGSDLAALAMSNSSSGPAAALSYPAGVRLKLPHGLSGALFLPEVVEFNVEHGAEVYSSLGRMVDLSRGVQEDSPGTSPARSFASGLRTLRDGLGLNRGALMDVDDDLIEVMCADLEDLRDALQANPVPFSVDDGRYLYKRVFAV